jgi:hypothetical protein
MNIYEMEDKIKKQIDEQIDFLEQHKLGAETLLLKTINDKHSVNNYGEVVVKLACEVKKYDDRINELLNFRDKILKNEVK